MVLWVMAESRGSVAGCYEPNGRGFDSRRGNCFFFFFQLTYSFRPQYGPEIYSARNRNEYQESSWVSGG
jgi:hypothetical protein